MSELRGVETIGEKEEAAVEEDDDDSKSPLLFEMVGGTTAGIQPLLSKNTSVRRRGMRRL